MAGSKHRSRESAEWMGDAWEWAADLAQASGHALQVSQYPSRRRGVWVVKVRLLEVVDGHVRGVALQLEGEYPNERQETYGAFLMNLLGCLERVAREGNGLIPPLA